MLVVNVLKGTNAGHKYKRQAPLAWRCLCGVENWGWRTRCIECGRKKDGE